MHAARIGRPRLAGGQAQESEGSRYDTHPVSPANDTLLPASPRMRNTCARASFQKAESWIRSIGLIQFNVKYRRSIYNSPSTESLGGLGMTPKLNCGNCGSDRFAYPFRVTDDATIECAGCGAVVGTFAELRSHVASQIAQVSQAAAS
jgi:hypothetical protein